MSGGDVQLCALERGEGDRRLVVRWLDDGQGHAVEIGVERRTLDGRTLDGWTLGHRVVIGLNEIHLVGDAIQRAIALAGTVRR